jgi:hypothetical protein
MASTGSCSRADQIHPGLSDLRKKPPKQDSRSFLEASSIRAGMSCEKSSLYLLLSRKPATIFGYRTREEPSTPRIVKGVAMVAQGAAFVYI